MAPTNKPTETDATADQGNATAEEQPQPVTYKRLQAKDGQPKGWPANARGSDGIDRYIPWI